MDRAGRERIILTLLAVPCSSCTAFRGNFSAEWWVWPARSALGDRSTFMSARETDAPNRCHNLKERKLNYATYKYHEKTLPLAGDRRLWFNTHLQPSGC